SANPPVTDRVNAPAEAHHPFAARACRQRAQEVRTMKTKLVIAFLLAALLPASAAATQPDRHGHRGHHRGILYAYEGTLAAVPSSTSFTVDIQTGNRAALQSLLGQSAEQTFSYDASTEFLLWAHGVPTVVPPSSLHAGDWVRVNIRAPRGASLAEIEATA